MKRSIILPALAVWLQSSSIIVRGFAPLSPSGAAISRSARRARAQLLAPLRAQEGDAAATEEVVGADDLLNSPAFLKKKIELLEKQLEQTGKDIEAANAEADEAWAEWGAQTERLNSEFDFVKQRMLNDTMEAAGEAKLKLLKDILPVSDNFFRASQAIKAETEGEEAVLAHYAGVYQVMQDVFQELGVTEVPTVGTPFDYNLHEAVMRQASDEHEEDVVCQEFAKGFMVGDKLIRPAMVAVSAG